MFENSGMKTFGLGLYCENSSVQKSQYFTNISADAQAWNRHLN
jgi:hypothetical protein